MKKFNFLILILLSVFFCKAQYFQSGQDPSNIKWRHLHSRSFQLIYPDYYESQAQKIAHTLETVYPYGSFSLQHNPKKIPLILHTQTINSNGMVAWAPKRIEFYTMPHQSIYPQDWLEQLAFHEFRHVVQIDKVQSNLSLIDKILLGEQSGALAFGINLPWWFIEGDAVVTETVLGKYGRGRLPSFLMEHRAQVIEKGVFSYDKAYLGSYKDFVPDYYKLGYYLVGGVRKKYGSDIWEKALSGIGDNSFSFSPFNKILKEKTGLTKSKLYSAVFDSLQNSWIKENREYQPVPYEVLSPSKKVYTNYIYSHWCNNSDIVSYRTAYNKIPAFVKIGNDGEEKRIITPGSVLDQSVDYDNNNGKIIWTEAIPDLRWEHSGHTLLRLYDIEKGEKYNIKTEYRCLSPDISPDGKNIVVVETDYLNNYYLSVYQIETKRLIQRYQSPNNNYFLSPVWINNQQVATVVLDKNGKYLSTIDFSNKQLNILSNNNLGDIKQLEVGKDCLYFISSYTGKDCLYRIHLETKDIEIVYEPRFGIAYPSISPDGKKIAASNYTSEGYEIITFPIKKIYTSLDNLSPANYELAECLADQEWGIPVLPDSVSEYYPSEKYKKSSNLFNFHSWAPVYVNSNDYEVFPGVSLMSQNSLGTSITTLGYKWDNSEDAGIFSIDYSYKGLYPIFDIKLTHGDRKVIVKGQDNYQQKFSWKQTTAELDTRIPLSFGKGPFSRLLQPEIDFGVNWYNKSKNTPDLLEDGSFYYLGYRFYYHQLLKKSYQDVYPDFGLILDITYKYSPFGKYNSGDLSALQSILYVPGIFKNHGLKFYGGAQVKGIDGTMQFSDIVRYARGWGKINSTDIYTGGIDYKFPLLYPDINLGGLLYMRRINASIFADFTRIKGKIHVSDGQDNHFTSDISSYGLEITTDVNFLRFFAPFSIGFRSSYLPKTKEVYYDMLFSFNLTSF